MQIDGTIIFADFSGGINTGKHAYHLPNNQYRDGNNVYFDTASGRLVKRRARTLLNTTALGAAIHSSHRFYIGGSRGYVVGSSTTMYNDNSLAGSFTSTATGLSGSAIRGEVFPAYGWWFFCDGTNMKKYDLTNVRNWGIAKPTTAITATPSGAGSTFPITNGYMYGYTFYNSATGHESEYLTCASTGASATADKVVVHVTASADAQVTNIKLYRTTDGGTTFLYHSTVANTTADIDDTTADTSLGAAYACAGNAPPTAAKDFCCVHNRFVLAGASMYMQVSQLGEPESIPLTGGYKFYLKHGDGVDVVRVWPYLTGTQNCVLAFKDRSIVAIYNLYEESPSDWEFRVVDNGRGLHAANSIAGKFGRIYWVSLNNGVIKVYEWSENGINNISDNIKETLNKATKTYMAGAVGWIYDNKYFLSFPSSSSSTSNDAIYFYDMMYGGWHPYSKNFGVTSAAVLDGSGDSGQMYVSHTSGYVDQMEVADTWGDRGDGYSLDLTTRWDDGSGQQYSTAAARTKQFWFVNAEMFATHYQVIHYTDFGFFDVHNSEDEDTDIWIGGWMGGWGPYTGNKIIDQDNCEDGMRGKYTSLRFKSDSNTSDAAVIMGTVDYEVMGET